MRRSAHGRFLLASATAWMLIFLAAFCLRTTVAYAAPGTTSVISQENDTWEENASSNTTADANTTTESNSTADKQETDEEKEREKAKKKHLAAEQYALGVILAGCITIGILIVMYFYWAKRSNIHDR